MEPTDEARRLLLSIGAGYGAFLKDSGLYDAILARMTYFSDVRKIYLNDTDDEAAVRAIVLEQLDRWMAQTQKAMNHAMQQQMQSMNLHVVTKRQGLDV